MSAPRRLSDEEREELIAYLDGELDAEASRAVAEKLQNDPVWRQEAEQLQTAWEMLDYLPQTQASAAFTEQTLTVLEATRRQQQSYRRWLGWTGYLAWGVSLLAAALLGYRFAPTPPPTPAQELPWPPSEEVLLLLEHRDYWPYYEKVGSFSFLRELEKSDLFDEGS